MIQRGWRLSAKQLVDRALAAAGIIAAGPVMAATAAIIRVSLGSPVLFRQTRPGFQGRPFTIVKFRTMRDAHDSRGQPLADAARVTRLGAFLRSTSLDELPQLFNVLRGELSLVGPRPLLTHYLQRYNGEQARRHDVMPGITGWSQIHGRNAVSWPEKLALDVWYVDHWSIGLDLKILVATVGAVLARKGVHAANHVTMPELPMQRYV